MLIRLGKAVVESDLIAFVSIMRPQPGDPEEICVGGPNLPRIATGLAPGCLAAAVAVLEAADAETPGAPREVLRAGDEPVLMETLAKRPLVDLTHEEFTRLRKALARYEAVLGPAGLNELARLGMEWVENEVAGMAPAEGADPQSPTEETEACSSSSETSS